MNWSPILKAFAAVALIATATNVSGCASGARSTEMVVKSSIAPTEAGQPGYKSFRVAGTQGGSGTNPLWMSNVSNEDFKTALEASLKATNYLADEPGQATAEVTASMMDLKRPMVGLDLSVTAQVRYSATEVNGGAIVFDYVVAATGTAKMSEAFMAVERLKLANEAAIRANIEAFILRLRERLSK